MKEDCRGSLSLLPVLSNRINCSLDPSCRTLVYTYSTVQQREVGISILQESCTIRSLVHFRRVRLFTRLLPLSHSLSFSVSLSFSLLPSSPLPHPVSGAERILREPPGKSSPRVERRSKGETNDPCETVSAGSRTGPPSTVVRACPAVDA